MSCEPVLSSLLYECFCFQRSQLESDDSKGKNCACFGSDLVGDSQQGGPLLSEIAGQSLAELQDVLAMHKDVQRRFSDPAAPEVLQADRLLAAVNKKAVSAC